MSIGELPTTSSPVLSLEQRSEGRLRVMLTRPHMPNGARSDRSAERRFGTGSLKKRAADVLAYFDRPGTSNGPTDAINGRLEHLRGSALGFRNLTNYIARSLLETAGFRPQLHPGS
jgi:hypothetical protein